MAITPKNKIMKIEGNDFRYFIDGKEVLYKDLQTMIRVDMTVRIEGLNVYYSSPKITTFKVETSSEDRDAIRTIQEIFKEIEEHQKQNGGILKGGEFPFDLYNKSEDEEFEDYIREQKVISDWERKEENVNPFTYNFDDIKLPKEEGGKKETENKTDYSEINLEILDLMAERFNANKHKYPQGNMKKPINIKSLEWALFRHIKKIVQPVETDEETYKDHLSAILCNASMILDQLKNNKLGYIK